MTNISPLVCDPRSYKRMTIITPRNQGNIHNDHGTGVTTLEPDAKLLKISK